MTGVPNHDPICEEDASIHLLEALPISLKWHGPREFTHRHLDVLVVVPFMKITGLQAQILQFDPTSTRDKEILAHPMCAVYVDTAYCREAWSLNRAMLRTSPPRAYWHRCPVNRLCALVPMPAPEPCWALRVACAGSLESVWFDHQTRLLTALVGNCLRTMASIVDPAAEPPHGSGPADPWRGAVTTTDIERSSLRRHVAATLRYVEAHFSAPELSVTRVAQGLDLNPDYLSHLFVQITGERLSHRIACRRVAAAQRLLENTDWQIKRVAHASGHANPNWFSHQFKEITGVAPCLYRERCREIVAAVRGDEHAAPSDRDDDR